ncbi:4'-phosphopantetheinyl transferase family protein [Lysinibacillus piscis]|uniref:4'-phosphopantetheinyl transferase superfamily protein n=1 Tax=Lysinibacillus piscis TaxID=2518931 RepID=A0ABQ5NPF7_9BACI|nr:4'-phosphopantetheinyl transferase superfamily protein [Lysinibacillus sp. KH24]GLC90225.1 hypothetical protein LYSBPC_33520 [Lysinibacillus sp. KH24]
MIHVWALPLGTELTPSEWMYFYTQLPSDEQLAIDQYRLWQDRQRALLGRILIRWALRQQLNIPIIQIIRSANGRPFAADWQGDFNLSHSGEWLVVALTDRGHVGIDVEQIRPVSSEVLSYLLSDREQQTENYLRLFYERWTLQEARFKAGVLDVATKLIYLDEEHPVSICWYPKQFTVNITVINTQQLI